MVHVLNQPEFPFTQAAPLITVRNTFLSDVSPKSRLRRCVSAEAPPVCDRYAVQLHTLLFRQQAVYSPKVLTGGCAAPKVEPGSPVCSCEESTASDIDGDDRVSEVSQRTASSHESGDTAKVAQSLTGSAEHSNSEQQDDGSDEAVDGIDALIKSEGLESLLQRVPQDESGNATSIGSILHEQGTCKPCVFAHSERKECQNGVQCVFCHFSHPPKRRLRFCKKRRMEMRRLADQEE